MKARYKKPKYLVIAGAVIAVGTAAAFGVRAWRSRGPRPEERNAQ